MGAAKQRKPSAARSRNMAAIRAKNTKPELIVRRLLHGAGFRYRLHRGDLPGKPDLSLPKWNAVIEVQGCFWHAHDCHLFRVPKENRAFWRQKLEENVVRDRRNAEALHSLGFRRMIVWECALKGRHRLDPALLKDLIVCWLQSGKPTMEIAGKGIGDNRVFGEQLV